MVNINRRNFVKNSAMAMMSYSMFGCASNVSAEDYDDKYGHSPNYYNGKFNNLIKTSEGPKPGTSFDMISEVIFGDEERYPSFQLPVNQLDSSFFSSSPANGLRVIWIGHSSMLIEIDGRCILIDPVWSDRILPVSFVNFAGPKRFHRPPIQISSLPKLDAVLISHDHYDHLDKATILALANRDTKFFVPLGVGKYLKDWGIPSKRIIEMDWWDSNTLGGHDFTIMATPARHYSGRFFSSIPTLWTSWTILGPHNRIFFSGDTGLLPVFDEIGKKFGPFDLTMIEIGAYHKHLDDIHVGPMNAVDVHLSLGGKILLPIHWGTFNLGIHAWTDPVERMIKAAKKKSVNFVVPKPGQPVSTDKPIDLEKWWLKSMS
ncbi:MAG: MBL fold metallo-hydrolase [Deltaproteobacteria bacterium]|nr:MBL fold metallo-hydrolase [Deltaproteobacteria bacterium]MBW2567651.1 MBL fold metallo-hydrolase [Deltaproteobacteria bacterium]